MPVVAETSERKSGGARRWLAWAVLLGLLLLPLVPLVPLVRPVAFHAGDRWLYLCSGFDPRGPVQWGLAAGEWGLSGDDQGSLWTPSAGVQLAVHFGGALRFLDDLPEQPDFPPPERRLTATGDYHRLWVGFGGRTYDLQWFRGYRGTDPTR